MQIDISVDIYSQFLNQLPVQATEQGFSLDNALGKGAVRRIQFPDALELLVFEVVLNSPFEMQSKNPANSEWLLLNVNLSAEPVVKTVNDLTFQFQRHLPAGMLFYTPHTVVSSVSLPEVTYKFVLVRFKRSFLANYLDADIKLLESTERAVIYEDLDAEMEQLLNQAISEKVSKFLRHGAALQFIGSFVEKLKKRSIEQRYEHLHPNDIKGLFMASARLRNPLSKGIPTIVELAAIAGMSTTKFKTIFKQVFGSPPIQYHRQIKLDFARQELLAGKKGVGEVGYEIGYSHPSKFTAAYKKQFGILPSEQ